MSSVFTKIMDGVIPGHFVHQDDVCTAFLTIEPIRPGHTLVVPRTEVDHFTDLPPDVWSHVCQVSQRVGQAIKQVYSCQRVGLLVEGFGVPHTHIHVWPAWTTADFDVHNVQRDIPAADFANEAQRLRDAVHSL